MSYKYERPQGKLYKVSVKEWNKVFANRGKWPFVVANVYLREDSATVHYNISLFGKIFFWTLSPLYFIIVPFICGFPDALKAFKDVVFDKEKGSFGSDDFHKIRHGIESQQWIKLMKLIGEKRVKTQEQVIKDFEDCIVFQKSVGEDTRGVENDLKNNLWHYENNNYYTCTKCKRPETARYTGNERMTEKQLCFGCNLWEKRLEEEFTKGNVFVHNRTMYSIGTYGISKDKYLGHGGTIFKITYPDGEEVVSNNVWCGGDLPFWLTEGFKTATMERVMNIEDVKHLL